MPLYVMVCDKCGTVKRYLALALDVANSGVSCQCGGTRRRSPNAPTVYTKEVLRFGHQVKDIERYDDSEKLYDERAHMDPRKPD